MTLQLTSQDIQKVLMDVLCNGGVSFLHSSGIDLELDDDIYKKHKQSGDCIEDVMMKMLNSGEAISFVDSEDDDSEYTKDLTLELATERLSNITDEHFLQCVKNVIEDNGDAEDGFAIIQFIIYGEVIFG